jgi:hypothetical protein
MVAERKSSEAQQLADPANIRYRRSEAILVLTQLGLRGSASEATFLEYIKSLRKLGIPFKRGEINLSDRGKGNYSYYHLMELILVLTLRVYNVVPDALLVEIIRHRKALYRCYRRAYTQRNRDIGAPISVGVPGGALLKLRGTFLDLQLDFAGGRLTKFGPPRLLSPMEALKLFAQSDIASRPFLPINLSSLAEKLIGATVPATGWTGDLT